MAVETVDNCFFFCIHEIVREIFLYSNVQCIQIVMINTRAKTFKIFRNFHAHTS